MAVDFDALNRATQDFNHNNVNPFNHSATKVDFGRANYETQRFNHGNVSHNFAGSGRVTDRFAYENNRTFKANNGPYPYHSF